MKVPRRNCDHMISQSEKWCLTCWEPLIIAAVDEARREEREAIRQVISAEASKHPGCCHHLRDAILARDKEPRDAER